MSKEGLCKQDMVSIGSKSFEELRKINEHGAEFWSARDLQPLLGYTSGGALKMLLTGR